MDRVTGRKEPGQGVRTLLSALAAVLVLIPCGTTKIGAQEPEPKKSSLEAGVLEIAGSTSFAVSYQKEGDRETTHLRLTPSIGYFILDPLQVQLRASYIFDSIQDSQGIDDRSEGFLFTLGPAYNFRNASRVLIPYAGVDFGTYYRHLSSSDASRSDVQLALGMQAGCRWMFTDNVGLKLGFQYVHGFGTDEIGDTNFLGLEIGISLFIPTWPVY